MDIIERKAGQMEKLLLIDGNSILNRAFYGLPDLSTSQGVHTNAILGFFNILMKIMEEEKPDYLTVAFDVHEPTFRHEMYEAYKGTRKPAKEEFLQQLPIMKELLKAMGICILEKAGYEADDILGTIAKQAEKEGIEVSLVSGDRDLLQIASDRIKIRIPKTKHGVTEVEDYYPKDVTEKYGVSPTAFIDMKGLMGDASDNIPGVPGIGEKTAAKIIKEFESIENAKEHLEEIMPLKAREAIRNHYDLAQLSKKLAMIKTDCELEYQIADGKVGDFFTEETLQMFHKLEFKNLISKYFPQNIPQKQIVENFQWVEDFPQAEEIFSKAKKAKKIGTSCIGEERFLGITLTFGEKDCYFIVAGGFLTEEFLLDKWNQLLEESEEIIFLDLKQNLPFLEKEEYKKMFDVKVAAYLLNPLKETYQYEDIGRDYLQIEKSSRIELLQKLSLEKAIEEKKEEFLKYACYISYIPFLAEEILKQKLKEQGMDKLFSEIEMPLIFTLYHMEKAGIRAEKEMLSIYGKKLGEQIAKLEDSIYEKVGEKFNINSPKQLGEILFGKLKLEGGKKTKTGYSTAADVLEKLAFDFPVVSDILEYRQLTKLKSTYADGLISYIEEDNRIHSKFNQTITATGRISSTEPNLQNIPIRMEQGREIRKVFVPEEDYVFIDADYSQIELRVLAHMSGDEKLIEAYKKAKDIHRITASEVFHVPFEEVTSLQRSNAKAVNFGIIYGISSFGLSKDLNISKEDAKEYMEHYFAAYPKIKKFIDSLVETAKEKGYSETLFGRRRPILELQSSNFQKRSFGERIAMNSPIQGTAADIIKIAMIQVDNRLQREGLRSRLILQVHDELLIEAHKEEIEQVKVIMEEEMQHAASLEVKLEIDMNIGKTWFDAK